LRNLDSLKKIFKNKVNYGFSDHTIGSVAAITSLKYGVKFIEKHFTLNKGAYGPDHKASMEPIELKNYIIEIKNSIKADGSSNWKMSNEEYKQLRTMRKGCYARYNLRKGDYLRDTDVIYLRPPNGISPKDVFLFFLNKRIKKDIKKGQPLKKNFFQ
jgi:sialic acid synthase SpsE